MASHASNRNKYLSGSKKKPTNEMIVNDFNQKNGISEEDRQSIILLFKNSKHTSLEKLIDTYIASMNQDRSAEWAVLRPTKPEIICGTLPHHAHEIFDILGIGGMFSYLNVLYQTSKNGGKTCIVTNPIDIFTFSGWTLHPEEDMDQRLIEMFQTKSLFINELKRLLGLLEPPRDIRYKSFRIDYPHLLCLLREDPKEFVKNIRVALRYALLEFVDSDKRFARINLQRNQATLAALQQMDRIGNDPEKDIVNLCGRVVFEVEKESTVEWKNKLKKEYGLLGKKLSPEEVKAVYGTDLKVFEDINRGELNAVQYFGGHFMLGYKDNALKAAEEKGLKIFDNAVVTKIIIDSEKGQQAAIIKLAGGELKTVVASTVLMALGDYGEDVITVDGISTLFAVVTENENYRLYPTGMGEGGTIHVVPVWSMSSQQGAKTLYYHLGKATNGAIMGRNPLTPKSLSADQAFLAHLESNLKKIIPPDSTFVWLAATECGRPVSAKQGYSVYPLQPTKECNGHFHVKKPLSFKASGGCGLGGNTAIIPEVQEILDRRAIEQ